MNKLKINELIISEQKMIPTLCIEFLSYAVKIKFKTAKIAIFNFGIILLKYSFWIYFDTYVFVDQCNIIYLTV